MNQARQPAWHEIPGGTLTISLTSNVERDSMYLSFKDDKVNFYLVFR